MAFGSDICCPALRVIPEPDRESQYFRLPMAFVPDWDEPSAFLHILWQAGRLQTAKEVGVLPEL